MRQLSAIGLTVLLAACGGGDSAAPSAPPPTVAVEGFWKRTAASGEPVALVILGTGETWGVHTTVDGSIIGALYGKTTASGATLSGSGKYIHIPVPSVTPGTYSGTFVAKSSIDVKTFTASTSSPFWGTYTRKADNQSASASLETVAGTFVGVGASGSSLLPTPSLTISGSGAITGPPFLGCSVSGTAAPHPGGNNIFNVTMKFDGVPFCALGKGDFPTGIAFYDTTTGQVVVMALKADQSDSFIFVGKK